MENNRSCTWVEEYAIELYHLIYLFHRRIRNSEGLDRPEEIVFDIDLPSKGPMDVPVYSPEVKRAFKVSSRRVHN